MVNYIILKVTVMFRITVKKFTNVTKRSYIFLLLSQVELLEREMHPTKRQLVTKTYCTVECNVALESQPKLLK